MCSSNRWHFFLYFIDVSLFLLFSDNSPCTSFRPLLSLLAEGSFKGFSRCCPHCIQKWHMMCDGLYIRIPFPIFLWWFRSTQRFDDLFHLHGEYQPVRIPLNCIDQFPVLFPVQAFAMLFAPCMDHLILRCFIRIVTAVQFWFSCTPMFLYMIPSGASGSLIRLSWYGISPSRLFHRYLYSSLAFLLPLSFGSSLSMLSA